MKKLPLILAVFLLLALGVGGAARAAGDDAYLGIEDLQDNLPKDARDVLGDGSIDSGFDADGAFQRILDKALGALGGILRSALGSAVAVLAAALLCSVASAFAPAGAKGVDYVNLVGILVITGASAAGVRTALGEAAQTVNDLADFSNLLLPVLASTSAATGAAISGAAKYAASALFLDILMTVGQKLILPLIYMFVAASAASAAFGGEAGGVAKLIARMVKLLLTGVALAFTVYLTVTGLVASSADAATVKVTKTAISTLLPVVGGMVSDAADAVASGVNVLRSAVGAFGMAAAVAVCVLPFLKLALGSFVFRAAAALAQTVTDKRLTGLMEAIASAYGMALGLAGTNLVMLFITILSAVKVVTA